MMRAKYLVHAVSLALASISIAAAAALSGSTVSRSPTSSLLYLVQAPTLKASEQSLDLVNAKVDRKFAIIHAVSAYLSAEQAERLRNTADVRVFRDRTLSSRSLLDSLLNPVVSTVGTVAAPVVTVATPVVTPVSQVAAPVTNPLLTLVTPVLSPVVTPLTAPLVTSLSSNQTLEDGSGVGVTIPRVARQTLRDDLVDDRRHAAREQRRPDERSLFVDERRTLPGEQLVHQDA